MAKYFEKKRSSNAFGGVKQFTLLFVAFLVGYLTASTYNLDHLTAWIAKQLVHQDETNANMATKNKIVEESKPKFEFYNLLTKETNPGPPKPNVKTASNPVSSPHAAPPPLNKENYILQVASFRRRLEAERMQAGLVMKGFPAHVVEVSQQQITWFRVMVGPFTTRGQAEEVRLVMARKERISGMIRRMDV